MLLFRRIKIIADTRRLDKYFYDLLQPKLIITVERVPATYLKRSEKKYI